MSIIYLLFIVCKKEGRKLVRLDKRRGDEMMYSMDLSDRERKERERERKGVEVARLILAALPCISLPNIPATSVSLSIHRCLSLLHTPSAS